MRDPPLLPLEQVPSFPAAEVQCCAALRAALQVGADQDALHPVVEVPHQLDWTLEREREREREKRERVSE